MLDTEPLTTGWLLTIAGLLVLASVLFSRPSERIGFPAVLLFLGIGLLASLWTPADFVDHSLAFRIGTVGLVLILFDGGLNTSWRAARPHLAPAAVLATAGVVGTAAIVAVAARLLGLGWPEALMIGAIVSSTDAAAVFSALRGSNVQLRRRVGATLELESGLNDPMAVILTITLTGVLLDSGEFEWFSFLADVVLQLAVGLAAGLAIGWLGQQLLTRVRVPAAGLYPAMTLALALLAFGIPTLFLGSGFLAVYVAALMLGNRRLPYRAGILRVHDALAWLGQITMFLVLGLLAIPGLLASSGLMGVARFRGTVCTLSGDSILNSLASSSCSRSPAESGAFMTRTVLRHGWPVRVRYTVPGITRSVPIGSIVAPRAVPEPKLSDIIFPRGMRHATTINAAV